MRLVPIWGTFDNAGGIDENISGSMGLGVESESESEAGDEDASEKSES